VSLTLLLIHFPFYRKRLNRSVPDTTPLQIRHSPSTSDAEFNSYPEEPPQNKMRQRNRHSPATSDAALNARTTQAQSKTSEEEMAIRPSRQTRHSTLCSPSQLRARLHQAHGLYPIPVDVTEDITPPDAGISTNKFDTSGSSL